MYNKKALNKVIEKAEQSVKICRMLIAGKAPKEIVEELNVSYPLVNYYQRLLFE